uniref:Uncharacterized protein n=1 Tax=Candidatus Kentrum sp. FM TaxID=2126340 RepID=A0A450TVQ4_9GAMM|nr:MAG: hypothetical protein BECKFM1743A_GA0114220_106802 [Candidatus Kentron sp. FM]VFJ72991.1 MAG: hypothetical protein BECKFM1743C_GA0114222_106912 [Candidatus Kentron sp. FM]VFK20444.1 MAG: hypothetical protein BECKFM1743B_GA0114221_106971 [Candidatus Kentron sp. FM]
MRFTPFTDIPPPSQRRQYPITRLAFAGLVHGHDPELQTHAARLVGERNLGIHGHTRVQPGLGIAFPALDFVGRRLAAFVGLFPVEGNPAVALARILQSDTSLSLQTQQPIQRRHDSPPITIGQDSRLSDNQPGIQGEQFHPHHRWRGQAR